MSTTSRPRLGFWRGVFYLLLAFGSVITVLRFTKGLGAVTNLSDTYPWGLWVGFDVLCGIGLASGGFILMAFVYLFHMDRFRPIVRAAVLTAFLGYLLEVLALCFDLGRPWNLWRPIVLWNPSSPLFAVAWCVIVYTTVLALEFSSVLFERLKWTRALATVRVFTVPIVVVGVLISILHQSMLGTLYLIVPGKLHALWYSPMLPILFLFSSISVGLAMIIVESRLSARAFGHRLNPALLHDLGRALLGVLAVMGVMRIYDVFARGSLGLAFEWTYEAHMFHLEIVAGIVAPIALLAFRRVRESEHGLYVASLLAVLGFMVNRLNVSITGLEGALGGHYVPSWSEAIITVMLVAIGFAGFAVAVRYLNVFPAHDAPAPVAAPPRRILLRQEPRV